MARILLKRSCRADRGPDREPLGTYSSQEYYYDDVTKQRYITGTPSGLPSCQIYSRPTTEKIDEYCEGSDSIEVYHDGQGDITSLRIEGGCGVLGCTLDIYSINITNETGPGLNDGSISFSFTQVAEHSLNGQTWTEGLTGSYQNLSPGEYTLYARGFGPEAHCKAEEKFIIQANASYELKWWFEYFDINGSETRVEIYGKGFAGVASEIEYIGSDPVIFDWKGKGQDKYRPIVYSECRLNVVAK